MLGSSLDCLEFGWNLSIVSLSLVGKVVSFLMRVSFDGLRCGFAFLVGAFAST